MKVPTTAPGVSADPLVSVIIGFKDRGLGRLEMSIRSIHDSLAEIDHEIIISDYGSADTAAIASLAERVSAHHEVVKTDGEWSAARARNAGVRASRGSIILAADADMLFTPKSLRRVVEQLKRHPQETVILQCRDLPTGYSDEIVRAEGVDWERFAAIAQLRPRWGVGGLVGLHRSLWDRLRGWDERMHTYGGEDTDFALRVRRAGSRIDWLDEPGVAMYHMWHPSSSSVAEHDASTKHAIAANRAIHDEDRTFARNRVASKYLPSKIAPLVSVIFEGPGQTDHQARAALSSILLQTVADIEVLVKSGSEFLDVADPRVRVASSDAERPNGTFTVTTTSQYIWTEDRLEHLLNNGYAGVGLISDYTALRIADDLNQTLRDAYLPHTLTPTAFGTLVRTDLLPELFLHSDNWADVIADAASSGTEWIVAPWSRQVHTLTPATEERTIAKWKDEAGTIADALSLCGLPSPSPSQDVKIDQSPLATAIATGGSFRITLDAPNSVDLEGWLNGRPSEEGWTWQVVGTRSGAKLWQYATTEVSDGLEASVIIQEANRIGAHSELLTSVAPLVSLPESEPTPEVLTQHAELIYGSGKFPSFWLAQKCAAEDIDEVASTLRSLASVNIVVERTIRTETWGQNYVLAHVRSNDRAEAFRIANNAKLPTEFTLVELLNEPTSARKQNAT